MALLTCAVFEGVRGVGGGDNEGWSGGRSGKGKRGGGSGDNRETDADAPHSRQRQGKKVVLAAHSMGANVRVTLPIPPCLFLTSLDFEYLALPPHFHDTDPPTPRADCPGTAFRVSRISAKWLTPMCG